MSTLVLQLDAAEVTTLLELLRNRVVVLSMSTTTVAGQQRLQHLRALEGKLANLERLEYLRRSGA